MYGLRGISEYVSAALLAIIVLGIGALVVSRIIEDTQLAAQRGEENVIETKLRSMQDLTVALAYIDTSSVLHVVVVSAEAPVNIEAIYVNNTLWNDQCSIGLVNGTLLSSPPNTVLPYYAAAIINCYLPAGTTIASVKIVYGGGEVYAVAKTV